MSSFAHPTSPLGGSSSQPASPAPTNATTHHPAIAYSPSAPSWRPLLHPGSEAISQPDFYPSKTGRSNESTQGKGSTLQAEDDMSEAHVRQGMTAKQAVMNESFSAHGLILSLLPSLVPSINALFTETLQRRSHLSDISSSSTPRTHIYKMPPRVTLNDVKLSAYIRDLADPTVPLSRLAKSIPHGFRGERMLEMLWQGVNIGGGMSSSSIATATAAKPSQVIPSTSNGPYAPPSSSASSPATFPVSVEIPRAIWFIRTVGASDLATRSRSAATISPRGYTVDFTVTCTSWLRKQLSDLSLCGTDDPSESRFDVGKWSAKWRYSLLLMDALQNQAILDKRTWCTFIVQSFGCSTFCQLPFTLALLQESLEDVLANDQLTKQTLISALQQCEALTIREKSSRSSNSLWKELQSQLESIVRLVWSKSPLYLLSLPLWSDARKPHLMSILLAPSGPYIDPEGQKAEIAHVELRARALLRMRESKEIPSMLSTEPSLQAALAYLDDYPTTHAIPNEVLAALSLQEPSAAYIFLCEWATTTLRPSNGPWRPILAAKVMQQMTSHNKMDKKKKGRVSPSSLRLRDWSHIDVNQLLSQWVESIDGDQNTTDFDRLILLFSELIRCGSFSYPRFLHRLAARGWAFAQGGPNTDDSSSPTASTSLQHRLLRSLPIPDNLASPALVHQRRLAVYGARTKETKEEATYRRGMRELTVATTFLTSPEGHQHLQSADSSTGDLLAAIPHVLSGSLYVRRQLITKHLLPLAIQWLKGLTGGNVTLERTAKLVTIMEAAEDWGALTEFISWLLAQANSLSHSLALQDLLYFVRDILSMRSEVWHAYGTFDSAKSKFSLIATALLTADRAEAAIAMFGDGDLRSLDLLISVAPATGPSRTLSNLPSTDEELFNQRSKMPNTNNSLSSLGELRGSVSDPIREWAANTDLGSLENFERQLLVDACKRDIFPVETVLTSLVIPQLRLSAPQNKTESPDIAGPALFQALRLWSGLTNISALSLQQGIHMRACLQTVSVRKSLQFAASLATVVTLKELSEESIALARVILHETLRSSQISDAITARPSLLSEALRSVLKGLWGGSWKVLRLVYGCLDGADLLIPHLESPLDFEATLVRPLLDMWRQQAALEELSFVLEHLAVVESSQQGRADAKVIKLSQALFTWLFLNDGAEWSRLWQSGGKAFRVATVEAAWKTLLAAVDEQNVCRAHLVLRAIFRLAQHCEGHKLPATGVELIDKLFSLLVSQLRTVAGMSMSALCYNISLLQALLLSNSLWTSTVVRSSIAELLDILFTQLLRHQNEEDYDPEVSSMLYDIVAYVLEELPSELHPSCSQALQSQAIKIEQESAVGILNGTQAKELERLLPFTPITEHAATDFVLAVDGAGPLPPMDNPWKWGDPLDVGPNTGATSTLTSASSNPHSHYLSPVTLPPLDNNGSLGLQHFAPKRRTASPLSPSEDYKAVENVREDYPRSSAGDDEARGWRSMPSERDTVPEIVEDVRDGRTLLPGASLVASSQVWDREGEAAATAAAADDRNGREQHEYEALAALVGLPKGKVRTMEEHLRREREKRAREARERREQKATLSKVSRFIRDQQQQQQQQQRQQDEGGGSASGHEPVDVSDTMASRDLGSGALPEGAAPPSSRKRKVSIDVGGSGGNEKGGKRLNNGDVSGDGKGRSRGRKKSG